MYFCCSHVGVKCTGHKNKFYHCEIAQESSCHEVDPLCKLPIKKHDKDAYQEYIANYFLLSNMRLIGSNKLAFSNASVHARMIYSLVRQRMLEELQEFLRRKRCLVNSITTLDALFIRENWSCFYIQILKSYLEMFLSLLPRNDVFSNTISLPFINKSVLFQ